MELSLRQDTFPYADYATEVAGIDWKQVEQQVPDVEVAKKVLYEKAIRDYIKETKQNQLGINDYEATLEAEKVFTDLRQTLNIPAKRSKDEQFSLIKPTSFQEYLRQQNLNPQEQTITADTFVDGYINSLHEDKWANPDLNKAEKAQLKARLIANIPEDLSAEVPVSEFLSYNFAPKPESLVETANKVDKQTGLWDEWFSSDSKRIEQFGTALKRSWVNEDVADAARRLANPPRDKFTPRQIPGTAAILDLTINDIVNEDVSPFYEDDPTKLKEAQQKQIEQAAQDYVESLQKRQALGEDVYIQNLMKADDFGSAMKALVADRSILPNLLAENGIDMAQEGGAQLGGAVAGGVVGSSVPVVGTGAGAIVGGSAASAAVAKANAYTAFFDQQIQKYLAEKKLPLTKESVIAFYNDKPAYQAAKDKASLSSSIVSGASFLSGAIGGGVTAGLVANTAVKAGFEPILEGGKVVFKRISGVQAAGAATAGTIVGGTIGTAGDVLSKTAVGESSTVGEVVASAASNVPMGLIDAGTGLAQADGLGKPIDIRTGEILYDKNGKGVVVTGRANGRVMAMSDAGQVMIDPTELGTGYIKQQPPPSFQENQPIASPETPLSPIEDSERKPVTFKKSDNQTSYVLTQAVDAIQKRDTPPPQLPNNLISALDRELAAVLPDKPQGAFSALISQVDNAVEARNGVIYTKKAYGLLAEGLKPLAFRDESRLYQPIITPLMNQDQVQARQWAADLLNFSSQRASTLDDGDLYLQLQNDLNVIDESIAQASSNNDTANLSTLQETRNQLVAQIESVNRVMGNAETTPTQLVVRDKALLQKLSDQNLFYMVTTLPDELDSTPPSLSPIAGSGFETQGGGRGGEQFRRNPSNNPDWFKWTPDDTGAMTPTFQGINERGQRVSKAYSVLDIKEAVQALKEGKPTSRRQETILRGLVDVAQERLAEFRRQDEAELDAIFGSITPDPETPVTQNRVDELNRQLQSTLDEGDFEFFVTRNGELPDDQYIARAEAVLKDPTLKASLHDLSIKSSLADKPILAPVPLAPKTEPVKAAKHVPTKTKFIAAPPERQYRYPVASNYLPQALLDQIKADGYTFKTLGNGDKIRGIEINLGTKEEPTLVTISSRGVSNPSEIKDRTFKVTMAGRNLADYGGNKNFTIPHTLPVIKASPDQGVFLRSVTEAADYAGFTTGTFSNNEVTITRGKESYKITNQNGKIFVDDQPIGEFASLQETPLTKQELLDQDLANTRAANLAEYQLRNPSPKPLTFEENVSRDIARKLDYVESPVTVATRGIQVEALGDAETTIKQARMDSVLINPPTGGKTQFTLDDVRAYVDLLPDHLREIIVLHDTHDNPAKAIGAHGFFANDYNGNGAQIHIDATSDGTRTLEGVISTLSEEVAHFVFDSWTIGTPQRLMKDFYDRAFTYYRGEIEGSLQAYIKAMNVDMKNPTTAQQYVLVNELFSRQGTSFTDLLDKKAQRPAGLTDEEVSDLRRIGREAQSAFEFDLMAKATNQDDAKRFAQEILKAQAAGVVGKQTVFDLKANGRVLRIVPTVVGQYRSVRGADAKAEQLSNRLDNLHKRGFKLMYANSPTGNLLMTRELSRIINNASGLDHERSRKTLMKDYQNSLMIGAILKRYGVVADEKLFKDGVRKGFEAAGINNKSQLKIADEADKFIANSKVAIIRGYEDISQEFDAHIDLLRREGQRSGVEPEALGMMIAELQQTKATIRPDYVHRRYAAFEDPTQVGIFEEMLNELRGRSIKKTLWQQKQDALKEIRAIRASSKSDSKKMKAIAEQEAIASKYDRLVALKKKFHFESNRARQPFDEREYTSEVISYLTNLLAKNAQYHGGNFTRMESISAMRGRELDWDAPEGTSDFYEIQFLQPVKNPVENMVFSVHQQQEVLRALQAKRALVEELLIGIGGDIAHIRGSQNHTEIGSDYLTEGERGSILNYVQIRQPLAAILKEQIEMQSHINQSLLNQFASSIKMGQTIFNPSTALANYYGIPFLLFANGHLLYFKKLLVDFPQGMRTAWRMRNQAASGDSYIETLVKEMHEQRVLGTGLMAGTLEINYSGGLHQKGIQLLIDQLDRINRDDLRIGMRQANDQLFEAVRDFYTGSDEAPKILGYMIEREKAEHKWRAKLDRQQFDSDANYQAELNRLIKREAADKTLRQYTDYAALPDTIKRASRNSLRIFIGDYITFPIQMLKSAVEGFNILHEEMADYREAVKGGHKEWKRAVGGAILKRLAGMVGIYSGVTIGTINGAMLLPLLIGGVADMLQGDEDEANKRDDLMDNEQRMAGTRLAAFNYNYGGSAHYEALDKEGDYLWLVNAKRYNPFSTFMQAPDPSTENYPMSQMGKLIANSVMGGTGDTIALQLYNAVKGIDRNGKEADDWVANFNATMRNLGAPGVYKAAYEIYNSQSYYTGGYKDRTTASLNALGVSVKKVYVPGIATAMGYEVSRYKSKRDATKTLINNLKSGSLSFTKADIVNAIESDRAFNEKQRARYNQFIAEWISYGYTKTEAINHLTFNKLENKKTGLSKEDARDVVNGVDIFSKDTLKDLNRTLSEVRKKAVNPNSFPNEFKENAISNLQFAIDQYKIVLNGKKD